MNSEKQLVYHIQEQNSPILGTNAHAVTYDSHFLQAFLPGLCLSLAAVRVWSVYAIKMGEI